MCTSRLHELLLRSSLRYRDSASNALYSAYLNRVLHYASVAPFQTGRDTLHLLLFQQEEAG